MKVTILQTDIIWNKPLENQKRVEKLIESSPQADLYVLPEMWSTGFLINPNIEVESENKTDSSVAWMTKMAKLNNAAICGSLSIRCGNAFVNRLYFISPDGKQVTYDKRHLFTPGGEGESYKKGTERVVVKFRGIRFLLQICYDLRFPVWSRNNEDYDAAIYVANWPSSRHEVWTTLLKARAIENQCYVIGVNRVGKDTQCNYKGGSSIISPYGSILTEYSDQEGSVQAEVDMKILEQFRNTFPVLKDRDFISLDAKRHNDI